MLTYEKQKDSVNRALELKSYTDNGCHADTVKFNNWFED